MDMEYLNALVEQIEEDIKDCERNIIRAEAQIETNRKIRKELKYRLRENENEKI